MVVHASGALSSVIGSVIASPVGFGGTPSSVLTAQPASPLAFYSLAQLDGWEGSCVRVLNRTDQTTQTDIGFSNGYIDIDALNAVDSGNPVTVVTWYDQSGNGNDLDNNIASANLHVSRIVIDPSDVDSNGKVGVLFWNTTAKEELRNATFAAQQQNLHMVMVAKPHSNFPASASCFALQTAQFSIDSGFDDDGFGLVRSGTLYSGAGKSAFVGKKIIIETANDNTNSRRWVRWAGQELLQATSISSATLTSLLMGDRGSSEAYFYGHIYHMALFGTAYYDGGTYSGMITDLNRAFSPSARANNFLAVDGDSIELQQADLSTTGHKNTLKQLFPLLNDSFDCTNTAVGGRTLATNYTNYVNNATNRIPTGITGRKILKIQGGINDIGGGTTGANLFSNSAIPYVQAAYANGFDHVILCTVQYNTVSANTAEIDAYNTLVRNAANIAAYGYSVIDYNADSALDPSTTPANFYDNVHVNASGAAVRAAKDAAVINALMAASVDAPDAVSDLAVDSVTATSATLSWTRPAGSVSSQKVQYSTDQTNWTTASASIAASDETYSVTGLANSTLYYFRHTATNSGGESSASNTASDTTAAPFSPSDITNLTFLYDMTDASSMWEDTAGTTAATTTVARVDDQSGNGHHITNVGASSGHPTLGITTINSQNVPYFNGDYLEINSFTLTQGNTIAIIADLDNTAGTLGYIFDGYGATSRQLLYATAASKFEVYAGSFAGSNATYNQNTNVHIIVFDGASSKYYLNGGSNQLTATAGTDGLAGITLGTNTSHANGMKGGMGYAIGYDKILTTSEVNDLGAYLATIAGTSWTTVT